MKKFLASLLTLTMLCSSVAVFCSAQDTQEPLDTKSITCQNGYTLVDGKCEKIVTENISASTQNNSTGAESPVSINWESFKNTLVNLSNDASTFCTDHKKGLAITGIVTAVVAIVGTTVYIFRNEIKDLAQKTANTVKEFSQKTIQKFSKTATN